MLTGLHVKNMALIEEVDLSFEKGLNVITGETGAGKSLLLGSVNLALGGKFSPEMMRSGADHALVELIFEVEDEKTAGELAQLGYPPEDGQIIITRKMAGGRATARVNGETCTVSTLRGIAECLITVHGQRENQTLLKKEKQLAMLDAFGKKEEGGAKARTAEAYEAYQKAKKEFARFDMDEEARLRELSLLSYELKEIEEAAVKEGEEEELEKQYRRMKQAGAIMEALNEVHACTGYEDGAGDRIGRAIRQIQPLSQLDETLGQIAQALYDAEAILEDVNRQTSDFMEEFTFSEQEFAQIEKRLDQIHSIQAKYGSTAEKIGAYEKKTKERLEFLNTYEENRIAAKENLQKVQETLEAACKALSDCRKACAQGFSAAIRSQMEELNFAQAVIRIDFSRSREYRRDGYDEIEICISTNPGEPVQPLTKVASGGELSRIMLAIRNILADEEGTGTLIFDEIDTGISGRTAQRVSEKMASIASGHQVLCVTHLAQIAAMADAHYLIEKIVEEGTTHTIVRSLPQEEQVEELARILGGARITPAVQENAAEMKKLAESYKMRK